MARRCRPHLQTNPMIAVMNAMNYDAMTLGNHEFNFGSEVFKGIFSQANFPHPGRQRRGYRRLRPEYGRPQRLRKASSPTSRRPSGAERSRSPSWASPTTACPTTSCPATSPA